MNAEITLDWLDDELAGLRKDAESFAKTLSEPEQRQLKAMRRCQNLGRELLKAENLPCARCRSLRVSIDGDVIKFMCATEALSLGFDMTTGNWSFDLLPNCHGKRRPV